MKVKELIEVLKTLPQECMVMASFDEGYSKEEVSFAQLVKDIGSDTDNFLPIPTEYVEIG